ncbi:hypothetical protein BJV77DRAFT_268263 [Russula vinacea]|nr:hypothetical protein BJV77DRAFT_268263 [Russula vinacea]
MSHPRPMQSPLPPQQNDTLPSNRECHTAPPTFSWTREYWGYVLYECSVAIARSPETGGVATLLVDATAKFCDEFVYKDELSVTQQLQQNSARGKARENEEGKKEPNDVDSFNPRYMYDVMKEMRRLKDLLDGQQQDAEEFFRFYLDTLDAELLASISRHKLATVAPGVEEREVSGQADAGKRGFTAESVESP